MNEPTKIPYAPVIAVTVTDNTPDGVPVLTMQTRLTRKQTENIDQISQIATLMQEAMEEIPHGNT